MSDKQKNITKVLVGLVVLLGGGGAAADNAGYTIDSDLIERIAGNPAILVVYLHFVWLPLVRVAAGKIDALHALMFPTAAPAAAVQAPTAAPVAELPMVASGPVLAVVKPQKS